MKVAVHRLAWGPTPYRYRGLDRLDQAGWTGWTRVGRGLDDRPRPPGAAGLSTMERFGWLALGAVVWGTTLAAVAGSSWRHCRRRAAQEPVGLKTPPMH
jgi:hypothetical protein